MDLLKDNYRDYYLGVSQTFPDAATLKLGAIDKVRIILSSHPSSVSLSKEQLERLAAEVKTQLENS